VPHSPEKLALRFVVLTHESSLGSERRGGAAPERALALQHASAQRLDDQREPIRSLTDARWRGGWWGPALGGFALDAVVGSAFARPDYGYGYGYPAYRYGSYGYPA
jgi:hypothetical protein